MSALTLAIDAALGVGAALLFVYVGRLTLDRHAGSTPQDHRALQLFAIWWFGLAASMILGAATNVLAILGVARLEAYLVLSTLGVMPIAILLWGLVYYLTYIYTGNERLFWPITFGHAALLAWLLYLTSTLTATGITVKTWNVSVERAADPSPFVTGVLTAVILIPAIAAAAAYGTLYWRTNDAEARYRIRMVSGAFLFWFGGGAIAIVTELASAAWWPPVSRIIALVATGLILAAYRPPRLLRERLAHGADRLRHVDDAPAAVHGRPRAASGGAPRAS